MINETFRQELSCTLTPTEKTEFSLKMARCHSEIKTLTNQKAESATSFKNRIEQKTLELDYAAERVATGIEYRQVECVREIDREEYVVRVVRKDTGDILTTRAMTENEKQMTLDEAEDAAQEPETNFQNPTEALSQVEVTVEGGEGVE